MRCSRIGNPGRCVKASVRGSSSHTSLAWRPEYRYAGVGELDCDQRPMWFGEHSVAEAQGARPPQLSARHGREVDQCQVCRERIAFARDAGAVLISATSLLLMTSNWPCTAPLRGRRCAYRRASPRCRARSRSPAGVSLWAVPHAPTRGARAWVEPNTAPTGTRPGQHQLADAAERRCTRRRRSAAEPLSSGAPDQIGADQELALGDGAPRTILPRDDGERPAGRRGQRVERRAPDALSLWHAQPAYSPCLAAVDVDDRGRAGVGRPPDAGARFAQRRSGQPGRRRGPLQRGACRPLPPRRTPRCRRLRR